MIKPEQMTAYDDASKLVEQAARILETINLARLNGADIAMIQTLISGARNVRATLYHEAHDAFLRARGLKES